MKRLYPASYLRFVALYNEELFWESHEVLEQPWRVNGSLYYKGLIILASVFVHLQRGNPLGVRKQSAKVLRYLPEYKPHYMGLDVNATLEHAAACHSLAKKHAEVRGPQLAELIPLHRIVLHDGMRRGDEPELNDP